MTDSSDHAGHLSDAEIDAYWMGKLSEADEERVERHYLDCLECQPRVAAVEALIDDLRLEPAVEPVGAARVRVWQLAAAVFAIAAAGATWQWTRLLRAPRVTPARTVASTLNTAIVPLAPPTRDSERSEVTLAPDVSIVIFELDATEAAAPGSRFDVALTTSSGRAIVRLSGIASSSSGIIGFPVERSLLNPGEFMFEVATRSGIISLPFLLREPNSR